MALHLTSSPYTLLVEDQGARVLDPGGHDLAFLPDLPMDASTRVIWGEALKDYLPRGCKAQILIARSNLEWQCQNTPYLNARERKDVVRRMGEADGVTGSHNLAYAFDVDAEADGGHQLWVAWHPVAEMNHWVGALVYAGASLIFATIQQRAFLAALGEGGAVRFGLAVESGQAHLYLYSGRNLLLKRDFRMPEDVDLKTFSEADQEVLGELLGEELGRIIQYVKQKHRGLNLTELEVVGLPVIPGAFLEAVGRFRLQITSLGANVGAFWVKGMELERTLSNSLNLVPYRILEARRLRMTRIALWSAAALLFVGLVLSQMVLVYNAYTLKQVLAGAVKARDQRKQLLEEAHEAGRMRLGLVRLRHAELRQKAAIEGLESIGLDIFRVPQGVILERVEVTALEGDQIRYRFEISGYALTRKQFSIGPLADYIKQLSREGVVLDPLRDIYISDISKAEEVRARDEGQTWVIEPKPVDRAVARFTLTGVAS